MSDRFDEPDAPGGPGRSGGGFNDGTGRDPLGASPPSGFLRGAGVVVVAVVVGALLMPSATRAPLNVANASGTSPTTTSPTTTTAPRARTTTTTQATIVPGASSIHVLVVNGTSITALAGGTATYLRSRGFLTLPATNSTTKVTGTQVYAVAGPASSATTVANALGLTASTIQPTTAVAPVRSTAGANVVVVAGPDLARLAPGSTTTSTGSSPG